MQQDLQNWTNLNLALRSVDEVSAKKLLDAEKKGKQRIQFMLRIYGRYNRLRSDRERRELLQKVGVKNLQ